MSTKVTFKITNTADPKHPFKTLSVPESAEFTTVVRFAAEKFGMVPEDAAIITNMGVCVNLKQPCGSVFLKYGSDLRIINRDKVGYHM